jgi:uncharacterized membrane protein YeaQ/YmgE (transglycosylase-associated protein family)
MALVLVGAGILALILFSALFWASGQLIGLGLHLLMAGLVGALADAVVPGTLPWGWVGAIGAGLAGSWLGVTVLGHLGPSLFGVAIIPGFLGAVVLAFALSLLTRERTTA